MAFKVRLDWNLFLLLSLLQREMGFSLRRENLLNGAHGEGFHGEESFDLAPLKDDCFVRSIS